MVSTMDDVEARRKRYERFADIVEIPMHVLSLLIVPVVVMPLVEDLSSESLQALKWLGIVLWIGFALDYVLLLYLSTDRWRTVKEHKLDLLLVTLPFLRPLRLLRVVHLALAGTAFARSGRAVRRLAGRPEFGGTLATVAGFVIVSGALVAIAEYDQPTSTISGLGDGIWWAVVTCTTVGYGDEFPVTATGRIVAVLLMLTGISGLSVITANIAAYFVSNDGESDTDDIVARLTRIEEAVTRLAQESEHAEP